MEQLNLFDLLVFIIVILSVTYGYRKGLVYQLGSVASLFISGLVAFTFMPGVSGALPVQNEHLRNTLAFLGILAVSSIVIWQLVNIISQAVQQMELTSWNFQMGGVVGFFQGILWSMICAFILALVSSQTHAIVFQSMTGYPLIKSLNEVVDILPLPQSHKEVIQKYTQQLQNGETATLPTASEADSVINLNGYNNAAQENVYKGTEQGSGYSNVPQTYKPAENNVQLPPPPQNPTYGYGTRQNDAYPNNSGYSGQNSQYPAAVNPPISPNYGQNSGYNQTPQYNNNPGYGTQNYNSGYNPPYTGYPSEQSRPANQTYPNYGPDYNPNYNAPRTSNQYDQGIPSGNYNNYSNGNPW